MPAQEVPVLAWVMYKTKGRVLRACYAPKFAVLGSGEEEMHMDYSEDLDEFFLPEGWYEWNDFDECHWKVSDPVTHWLAMPDGPAT